jgi:orotate phosphoribosyltransferase
MGGGGGQCIDDSSLPIVDGWSREVKVGFHRSRAATFPNFEFRFSKESMTENEILKVFRENSALLEGHFVLSSGLHSDRYIQCALVLQHPKVAEQLCSELAAKLRHVGATVVAAPALGGILVAHEVARALGIRALFTERQDGNMTLRRGFSLASGELTLVVEDVMTTGLSTRETMRCVEEAGGKVVGAGALIDRSGGSADLGVPKAALATLSIQNYNPAECPLCKSGIPAVKPGSRSKPAGSRQ